MLKSGSDDALLIAHRGYSLWLASVRASVFVSKKRPDRERVKERLLDIEELSGGPHRISAINRHRQFALLQGGRAGF